MRIVAGKFRSQRIEAPKGLATRPTSDRVRQALFNVLEHGAPQFDFAGIFSEGLAGVRLGDRWGFIDRSGKFVEKTEK